jgi:hypothetical protein
MLKQIPFGNDKQERQEQLQRQKQVLHCVQDDSGFVQDDNGCAQDDNGFAQDGNGLAQDDNCVGMASAIKTRNALD